MRTLVLVLGFCVCVINGVDEFKQVNEDSAIFPTLPIVALWSNNERCRDDSRLLLENLRNSTTWAMQMLEASARSAVGVLKGRVYQLGDYDECVETVTPIQGRYCLATVTVARPQAVAGDTITADFYDPTASVWGRISAPGTLSRIPRNVVHWALCVPASCSHSDVQASIDRHLASSPGTTNGTSIRVQVDAALCGTGGEGDDFFSYGNVAYCCVVAIIAIVVLSGTIYDFAQNNSETPSGSAVPESRPLQYLLCFSIRRNFLDLTVPESNNRSLDCLCGIRVLSICVVIICHRIGNTIGTAVQNYEYIERETQKFARQFLFQGDVSVDTFFVLSGMLVTYIMLSILDRTRVNYLQAIILRFCRLTPAYMLVVFFCSTVMYHLGDGPLWNLIIGLERDTCQENWWTNLLYINNYVNSDRMCMVHSWFLPCDQHFFMISIFIIKLLHTKPRAGYAVLSIATIASIIVPGTITFLGRKAPLLFFQREFLASPRSHEIFQSIYSKSHTRAAPYLVGIATGYFLYRTKKYDRNYVWQTRVGLLVSVVLCSATLIPGNIFYNSWWQYDVVQATLFAGMHRFVWAVGISAFMLSMIYNEKSMLGAVMSWGPMVAVSKLVYSAYLVHMVMLTMQIAALRTPEHTSVYNFVHDVIGDIVLSMGIGLVLYLAVEAPIRLIFGLLMSKEVPGRVALQTTPTNSMTRGHGLPVKLSSCCSWGPVCSNENAELDFGEGNTEKLRTVLKMELTD